MTQMHQTVDNKAKWSNSIKSSIYFYPVCELRLQEPKEKESR